MSKVDPITPDQLRELRKFQDIGKRYMHPKDAKKKEEEFSKPPKKSLKYYFRHPYFRMLTAYSVVFLNFYMFAEDPVSDSVTDCIIDLVGHDYAFIFERYPPDGYSALKVFMWIFALIFGIIIGKFVIHQYLFCTLLKVKIFTKEGQGSWMVCFLFTFLVLFVTALIYNNLLILAGESYEKYHITNNMGIENQTFMKWAAIGTWLGDFFTAWMVTDMMLQERAYPFWMKRLRKWWNEGRNRVIAFWVVALGMTILVVVGITTDFLNWDQINRDFVTTNELSRAFLASFILVFDLLIIMQDWDFPHFAGAMDIKLPGMNYDHVGFSLPKCCGCSEQDMEVHISGKWFNYGIIFIVMILDLNMWKNQIFYEPFPYGQYTSETGHIYSILDRNFLSKANKTMVSFEWRSRNYVLGSNISFLSQDLKSNSKYFDYPLRLKGLAFVPSMFALCMFLYLIYVFGQEENPEERMVRFWRESHFRTRRKIKVEQNSTGNVSNGVAVELAVFSEDGYPIDAHGVKITESQLLDKIREELTGSSSEDESFVRKPYPPPMRKNLKYFFRHPNTRLVVVYMGVILSWLMIAEDPISHSKADAKVDVIGNAYALILARYPSDGYAALKIFFGVCAILSGTILGKFFVHKVILCRLFKLKIFSEDGQGSWTIMTIVCVISLYLWSLLFNQIIKLEGPTHTQYIVTSNMHITFKTFLKGVACFTWLVHFATAWMVTDIVLQEKQYPYWRKLTRRYWRTTKGRIYIFWFVFLGTTVVVITAITVDFVDWDKMSNGTTASNEVSRSFLAAFIVVTDLLVIMQDWEFPKFSVDSRLKLPGINKANPKFKLCGMQVEIKSKWFCYGLVALVLILDVYSWKNQLLYDPVNYGQYTDQRSKIYSIIDRDYLSTVNNSFISYQYRISHNDPKTNASLHSQDVEINAMYYGDSLAMRSAAFLPVLVTFVFFILLGIRYSKSNKTDKEIFKEWERAKLAVKLKRLAQKREINLQQAQDHKEDLFQ